MIPVLKNLSTQKTNPYIKLDYIVKACLIKGRAFCLSNFPNCHCEREVWGF